jgi:hypothetical protein
VPYEQWTPVVVVVIVVVVVVAVAFLFSNSEWRRRTLKVEFVRVATLESLESLEKLGATMHQDAARLSRSGRSLSREMGNA